MTANIRTSDRDPTAGLSLLTRALKEPTLRGVAGRLIERARPRTGPTKYSWSLACSGRSGHGSHYGGSRMRGRRDSPPATRQRPSTSTSITPAASSETPSRTREPSAS
jgi:hypothetical protein